MSREEEKEQEEDWTLRFVPVSEEDQRLLGRLIHEFECKLMGKMGGRWARFRFLSFTCVKRLSKRLPELFDNYCQNDLFPQERARYYKALDFLYSGTDMTKEEEKELRLDDEDRRMYYISLAVMNEYSLLIDHFANRYDGPFDVERTRNVAMTAMQRRMLEFICEY